MKQRQKLKNQRGFTIIELLVVLAIMGLFLGAVLVNYARTRGPRSLRIAQNEMVTNIRKVQSYVLSSRNTSEGPVKYYVLKFDEENPTQYVLQAVQQDYSNFSDSVETFNLPNGITITAIDTQQPYGSSTVDSRCAQIAFSLPFNKMFLDTTCDISGASNSVIRDQGALDNLDNSLVTITMLDSQSNTTRSVIINGVSGVVSIP